MKIEEFEKKFIETFGFLLSQEIALEAPVDTGRLRNSFASTLEVQGYKLIWSLPFYWEFVEFGTIKQSPNPFVRRTIENKAETIAKKAIQIISKR